VVPASPQSAGNGSRKEAAPSSWQHRPSLATLWNAGARASSASSCLMPTTISSCLRARSLAEVRETGGMKLSGAAFPLRQSRERLQRVFSVCEPHRGLCSRSADDAQVWALRSPSNGQRSLLPAVSAPMCQCRGLGRERPRIRAHRLRPSAQTPGGRSRPSCPPVASSARMMFIVFVKAARASSACSPLVSFRPGRESLRRPALRDISRAPAALAGHHTIKASSCARRRARLVASLRPRACPGAAFGP
jgi:hypothetical protein